MTADFSYQGGTSYEGEKNGGPEIADLLGSEMACSVEAQQCSPEVYSVKTAGGCTHKSQTLPLANAASNYKYKWCSLPPSLQCFLTRPVNQR